MSKLNALKDLQYLDEYIQDYDLGDAVAVEKMHIKEEWVKNSAAFDLELFEEAITSGSVSVLEVELSPKTIAMFLLALELKITRIRENQNP